MEYGVSILKTFLFINTYLYFIIITIVLDTPTSFYNYRTSGFINREKKINYNISYLLTI